MGIVCEQCGHVATRLRYEATPRPGTDVRIFLTTVVASGLVGMYNLTTYLFTVIPIVDTGEDLGIPDLTFGASSLALLRDFVQLYNNSTRYFLTVMFLVMVAVPTRLLYLVLTSLRGDPRTLRRIRTMTLTQFGVEAFATTTLLALAYKLEVIEIPSHFGLNLVLAPLAYAISLRPLVRAHFSLVRFEPVATPAGPP